MRLRSRSRCSRSSSRSARRARAPPGARRRRRSGRRRPRSRPGRRRAQRDEQRERAGGGAAARQPAGSRPARPRVGQRREASPRLRSRWGSSCGGRMISEPSRSSGTSTVKPGAVVGDLEQHAAGLAEVDRVEVVAVDDARGRDARAAQVLVPAGMLGDGRAPGDVVHRARALAAAARRAAGRRRSSSRARRRAAPRSPRRPASAPSSSLEHRAAALGSRAVRAHALEALQRASAGISGCAALERLVAARRDGELVAEALGVGEAQALAVALGRHALGAEAPGPEVDRVGRADAPDDAVHHPGAGAARDRARVLEERQLGAGVALLVGEEQVVDGRVVLVDRLGDQAQAQHARVEVDVPAASPVIAVMWWMPSSRMVRPGSRRSPRVRRRRARRRPRRAAGAPAPAGAGARGRRRGGARCAAAGSASASPQEATVRRRLTQASAPGTIGSQKAKPR